MTDETPKSPRFKLPTPIPFIDVRVLDIQPDTIGDYVGYFRCRSPSCGNLHLLVTCHGGHRTMATLTCEMLENALEIAYAIKEGKG